MPELTPDQNASMSLAHMLVGLMKIDGAITLEEERKLEILLHKLGHGLPGDNETILRYVDIIRHDAEMLHWKPFQHLDSTFQFFDIFVASGQATYQNIEAVIDLADVMAEVDGMSGGEVAFLEKLLLEFNLRYRTKS